MKIALTLASIFRCVEFYTKIYECHLKMKKIELHGEQSYIEKRPKKMLKTLEEDLTLVKKEKCLLAQWHS